MMLMRLLSVWMVCLCWNTLQGQMSMAPHYPGNREPLTQQQFLQLPLGSIQPQGHLKTMLELQRDGLTGHLDSIYRLVCGPDNAWLGGNGDCWERGPYWIDGLIPLAYILDDPELKAKAQQWIEWSLNNQRPDGYFGPYPIIDGVPKIKGTQQTRCEDWWPKMVMLKAMQQYYSATNDPRVIGFLTSYFSYQREKLPQFPLNHWSWWGQQRGGDNLQVVLWLYSITGKPFLLELADIIHQQTFDWSSLFSGNDLRRTNPYADLHCVNIAQGLKAPVMYYRKSGDEQLKHSVRMGLESLKDVHGFVNGMYGADEALHGNDPTQGSEFCSAVEMMYSFESILPVTGDLYYADYLEKIAYNVLPTQADDQFLRKQYYQQVNQVLVTDAHRHFDCDYYSSIVFGTTSGYPCCLTNMHQGWPKFVQNLWYATADRGVAALVYGPSSVKVKVGEGEIVELIEKTDYPFSGEIEILIRTKRACKFPLYLRIPGWCTHSSVKVGNEQLPEVGAGELTIIRREWKDGDVVKISLPMSLRFSRWYEQSLGIERGPLVYALKVEEEWKECSAVDRDDTYWEVFPKSPWNYGIPKKAIDSLDFRVIETGQAAPMPWNPKNAPIRILTKGKRIPYWGLYENSAGKIPNSPYPRRDLGTAEEEITLIPYGCTTLRIAEFPVVEK